MRPMTPEFAPYEYTEPGFEAVYVDTEEGSASDMRDKNGRAIERRALWTWTGMKYDPTPDTLSLDTLQSTLGDLNLVTRLIRTHIASLAPSCDSGVPVTVDELLEAIGHGKLKSDYFRNGCYYCSSRKRTDPGHSDAIEIIRGVLRKYLEGVKLDSVLDSYPQSRSFAKRAYEWLGPAETLSRPQILLIERMLLPFDYYATHEDIEAAFAMCCKPGGKGAQIDDAFSEASGLPKIDAMKHPSGNMKAHTEELDTDEKKKLFHLAVTVAHGHHLLCDCHHSTFRWIEAWIYGIGQQSRSLPLSRVEGTERLRLGRTLFSYCLGLDRWLQKTPMQLLLLDLGHVDLGFDPKNDILRTYAHLGEERSPTKTWLAGSLWQHLHSALLRGNHHRELLSHAADSGISLREWMNHRLEDES